MTKEVYKCPDCNGSGKVKNTFFKSGTAQWEQEVYLKYYTQINGDKMVTCQNCRGLGKITMR